jgi:hypothetical protein
MSLLVVVAQLSESSPVQSPSPTVRKIDITEGLQQTLRFFLKLQRSGHQAARFENVFNLDILRFKAEGNLILLENRSSE